MVLGTDYFRTKPLSHSTYIFQVSGFGHSRAEPEEIGRARDSESAGFGDHYLSRNDEQPMKFHMENSHELLVFVFLKPRSHEIH